VYDQVVKTPTIILNNPVFG